MFWVARCAYVGARSAVLARRSRPGWLQERFQTKASELLEPFWPKMSPKGRFGPLEHRKSLQNRTFEHRSALRGIQTSPLEGGSEKTWTFNENGLNNQWFLRVSKAVSQYTPCLFHTFAIFVKMKNLCNEGPQKVVVLWPKMALGASQGRLLARPGTFLGDVEKSLFFDVALGCQKIH